MTDTNTDTRDIFRAVLALTDAKRGESSDLIAVSDRQVSQWLLDKRGRSVEAGAIGQVFDAHDDQVFGYAQHTDEAEFVITNRTRLRQFIGTQGDAKVSATTDVLTRLSYNPAQYAAEKARIVVLADKAGWSNRTRAAYLAHLSRRREG